MLISKVEWLADKTQSTVFYQRCQGLASGLFLCRTHYQLVEKRVIEGLALRDILIKQRAIGQKKTPDRLGFAHEAERVVIEKTTKSSRLRTKGRNGAESHENPLEALGEEISPH
jgi:hypothetical protein